MAKYRVWSGGDNTGGADNTNWSQAYQTLAGAIAAPPTSGDVILIHKTHQETSTGTVTWTLPAGADIQAVDKDASEANAVMGTGGWIGGDTNFVHTLTGGGAHRVNGLTIRVGSTSARSITIATTDASQWEFNDLYVWTGNTNSSSDLLIGDENSEIFIAMVRPTFRFGHTGQSIVLRARLHVFGGSISSAGSAPTTVFENFASDVRKFDLDVTGCDLSHAGSGVLIADNGSSIGGNGIFRQCKFGSGYVLFDPVAVVNRSGLDVYAYDCASGDNNISIHHANALGSVVIDTGIYVTADAEALSWKIVTTANASPRTPYRSPWIRRYNSTLSAMTPYFEVLRDGSATAYTDEKLFAEFMAKVTSGFPISTFYADRMAFNGTPANQANGTGTGNWTGEGGSAWSGKLDSGSALTPAEVGDIRGRVCFAEASSTIYVSPRIRV